MSTASISITKTYTANATFTATVFTSIANEAQSWSASYIPPNMAQIELDVFGSGQVRTYEFDDTSAAKTSTSLYNKQSSATKLAVNPTNLGIAVDSVFSTIQTVTFTPRVKGWHRIITRWHHKLQHGSSYQNAATFFGMRVRLYDATAASILNSSVISSQNGLNTAYDVIRERTFTTAALYNAATLAPHTFQAQKRLDVKGRTPNLNLNSLNTSATAAGQTQTSNIHIFKI